MLPPRVRNGRSRVARVRAGNDVQQDDDHAHGDRHERQGVVEDGALGRVVQSDHVLEDEPEPDEQPEPHRGRAQAGVHQVQPPVQQPVEQDRHTDRAGRHQGPGVRPAGVRVGRVLECEDQPDAGHDAARDRQAESGLVGDGQTQDEHRQARHDHEHGPAIAVPVDVQQVAGQEERADHHQQDPHAEPAACLAPISVARPVAHRRTSLSPANGASLPIHPRG